LCVAHADARSYGLAESNLDGRPVFGLIYAPAHRELYLTSAPGEAVAASFDCAAPRALSDLDLQILHVRKGETGRIFTRHQRSIRTHDHGLHAARGDIHGAVVTILTGELGR